MILQLARQEADQLRATAMREGYADGQARALEEWAEQRRQLRDHVEQVGAAYRSFCHNQIPDLVTLATAAAEKLLHDQLTLEPKRVVTIVEAALEQVLASNRITLHLHPDDLEIFRTRAALPASRLSPSLELCADPTLQRGGCRIESDHGEVDATHPGAFARLHSSLLDEQ